MQFLHPEKWTGLIPGHDGPPVAYNSIITATHLAIAGVTGDLATLLSGKTVAAASDELEIVMAAVLSNGVAAGGMVRYSLDGQSVETSLDTLIRTRDALRNMARATCGPSMLPIEFSA